MRRERRNEFPIICISFRIEKLESTLENYDREKGADILPQKEEMIKCLQSELIKVGNFTTICIPAFQLNYILMNFVKIEIG